MHSRVSISGLFIYPVKSCGGIALSEAMVEERGLRFDRRWMLVDTKMQFMTQRSFPAMALLTVGIEQDHLVVTTPGMNILRVPFEFSNRAKAVVWDDEVDVGTYESAVDTWFSTYLGVECHLVYQPDDSIRKVDPHYVNNNEHTNLSDGYPFLVLSEASLAWLNERLSEPVTIDRFRPNIVVTGCPSFAEDEWKTIRIGNIDFHIVKPCARCAITTVDQRTGKRTGPEPLRTLSEVRNHNNKALFGQNAVASSTGIIKRGTPVEVIR
jgi:uncharacterized protein YcbX